MTATSIHRIEEVFYESESLVEPPRRSPVEQRAVGRVPPSLVAAFATPIDPGLLVAAARRLHCDPAPVTARVLGLGVAALAAGLAACLTALMPSVGLITIPLAAIGLALAVAGFLANLEGRRVAVAMPIAGGLACMSAVIVIAVSGVTPSTAIAGATPAVALHPPVSANPSAGEVDHVTR